VSEPGIVPDHMELEAVTEETTYVELMEDNIQVDDLANASNNDNLDRVFAAGGSSSSWPSSTISQRLTRNRDKRDTGPPAMTVGDIRPTGTLFCLYLCSGPRRPADLAEQLNLLGALSVVLIDPTIGKGEHDLRRPEVVDELVQLASRPECVAVFASPPCNSFSALQFNRVPGGAKLCRDKSNPRGYLLPNGDINPIAKLGNDLMEACLNIIRAGNCHGAHYWIENPVARASGRYAIAGREMHASMWDHPSMIAFLHEQGGSTIDIDQCMLMPPDALL